MAFSEMTMTVVPRFRGLFARQVFKKHDPSPDDNRQGEPIETALTHLALTSPHLLPDLGFQEDPHASNAQRQTWRRDDVTVVIHSCDEVPAIQVKATA